MSKIPKPKNIRDSLLSAIAKGGSNKIPTPNNSEDYFLAQIAKNGIGNVDIEDFDSTREKLLEINKSSNLLNIAVITDLHYNKPGNVNSGIPTFKRFCKEKLVDFAVCLGDWIDVYDNTRSESLSLLNKLSASLNEIPVPIYFTQGNHDRNGKKFVYDENGNRLIYDLAKSEAVKPTSPTCPEDGREGQRYVYDDSEKLSNTELYLLMNKQNKENIIRDENDPSGNYFYKDLEEYKIRAIFLNSTWGTDETNAYYTLGQKQIKWIIEKALNFSDKSTPSEWQVLIFSHCFNEIKTNERDRVVNALKAFIAGTDFTSNNGGNLQQYDENGDYIYDGDNTKDASPVQSMAATGSYSTWNGGAMKIIAVIQGHAHVDKLVTTNGFNDIWVDNAFAESRHVDTDKEVCFDIFTIDRDNGKIYSTRYNNRGVSREFAY